MSSVQPFPLYAGGDAAVSAGALEATTAFHVVLGADGSVAIERSHDAAPAVASEPALPAVEAPLPALNLVRPSMRGDSAPARQLRWSFAGGALAATVALVAGYLLFERWSEAATASRFVTSTGADPNAVTAASNASLAATAIVATPAPPPPSVAIELPADPPAAGGAARVARSGPARDAAPPPLPQPRVGPCTAAVAALGLCNPVPLQGGP